MLFSYQRKSLWERMLCLGSVHDNPNQIWLTRIKRPSKARFWSGCGGSIKHFQGVLQILFCGDKTRLHENVDQPKQVMSINKHKSWCSLLLPKNPNLAKITAPAARSQISASSSKSACPQGIRMLRAWTQMSWIKPGKASTDSKQNLSCLLLIIKLMQTVHGFQW